MSAAETRGIRFQPDETPAPALSLGLGLQIVILSLAGIILIPTIVMRAGGASESYLSWAVFATVAICGATTILHAIRIWRIGTGHLVVMGPTGVYIAVCITAVAEGGPALMATLVVVSSVLPLVLAARLPLFQRLLTPTLSATVLMLIPVTVMPAVFGLLTAVPDGTSVMASALSALAVLLVIVGIALKVTGAPRLWAPIVGVVAGSVVAAAFGLYDTDRIIEAPWIGFPTGEWAGFDLEFGPAFWSLLPTFLLVTIIASVRTISGAVAIQRVSWRRPRAVDFRAVQGSITVDGLGNLLTGLAGTVPNASTTVGASVTELTGVASRSVGIATGAILVVIAFLPKALAVVLAIPGPVVAAYLGVLLAMIFIVGMSVAMRDGIDYRKGLIIGVSFWVGIGFQYDMIYPEHVSGIAGGLLRNGVMTGGATAILMTLFVELTKPRRSQLVVAFETSSMPKIRSFLGILADRNGWGAAMAARLDAACEETLLTLLHQDDGSDVANPGRRLRLAVHREGTGAVVEFVVAAQDVNLQDRLALIGDEPGATPAEREVSLRLLRGLASSVHHQQYHGVDIVTVRVAAPMSDAD
uniref:SupE n=1 Tax=Aplysina aerophoba bacterial symbiont clone pAPKS18 TaxID=377637 RepID=A4U8R2_9BACT|nr:SupE [Aplysina aerophoba bacterial symbiont clone pAPKS18]